MEIQCRACTSTTSSEYVDFMANLDAEISYLDYFNQLTRLDVVADDGLPNTFCTNCCHDLQVSYQFTQVAKQADEVFRQFSQEEHHKTEIQCVNEIDYMQEEEAESVYHMEASEHIEEEIIHIQNEDNLQIAIVSSEEIRKSHGKNVVNINMESLNDEQEVHEDIVAEEILECQEDDINVESIQFDEVDIDSLDDIDDLEGSTKSYSLHIDEYYPEDENDDQYLIEYDPNDISANLERVMTNGEKWKCPECKRILRGDVSYEGHLNMHKNVRPFECSQCQCAFRCKDSLKRHSSLRHEENSTTYLKKQSKCCRKRFKTLNELKNHECPSVAKDSNEILLKVSENDECLVYNRNDYQKEDAPDHSTDDHSTNNVTEEETDYNCKFCDDSFASLYELRNHMKDMHPDRVGKDISYSGEPLEQCKVCGKKLLKRNIAKHMEIHQNNSERSTAKYICAYCSREFKNSKSLYHHEKMHKGEQPDVIYVCNECDKQYHSQYLMEQHRKHAHKERDHVCNICGNAFKLKNQLLNHMKLHLKRDIQCSLCDKKYARTFDLNVHMRTHTGELPFACHLCDKRFAIKVRLTYHLQKHYGIKHRCKECGAEFNSRQKLKAHTFKHTGMPYICEICNDHGFSNRDVFKRHLLRVHKTTMSDEDLRAMFQRNTGKATIIQTVDTLGIDILASASNEIAMKMDSLEEVEAS